VVRVTLDPFGLLPQSFYLQDGIIDPAQAKFRLNVARTMSIVVAVFMALTLTHAAFVDYRSGASGTGVDAKQMGPMQYLQARKFGVESSFVMLGKDCWRGKVRQMWTDSGLECSVFELLVRMRGGPTRARLLRMLAEPKNKLQLANAAGIDWKAVDRHIDRLLEHGLVKIVTVAGTCTMLMATEKGTRAISVLEKEQGCN
jgi:DNA-binding transcriptional ArsR family regulator